MGSLVAVLSPDFYIDADSVRVRTLMDDSMDRAYLERWAARLGVAEVLADSAQ